MFCKMFLIKSKNSSIVVMIVDPEINNAYIHRTKNWHLNGF